MLRNVWRRQRIRIGIARSTGQIALRREVRSCTLEWKRRPSRSLRNAQRFSGAMCGAGSVLFLAAYPEDRVADDLAVNSALAVPPKPKRLTLDLLQATVKILKAGVANGAAELSVHIWKECKQQRSHLCGRVPVLQALATAGSFRLGIALHDDRPVTPWKVGIEQSMHCCHLHKRRRRAQSAHVEKRANAGPYACVRRHKACCRMVHREHGEPVRGFSDTACVVMEAISRRRRLLKVGACVAFRAARVAYRAGWVEGKAPYLPTIAPGLRLAASTRAVTGCDKALLRCHTL